LNSKRLLGVLLLLLAWSACVAVRLCAVRGLDGTLLLGWPGSELGQYRVGAVASASVAGALLGVSGAFLQGLLRNPLASPFVLGISSGAGLGVAVAAAVGVSAGAAVVGSGGMLAISGTVGGALIPAMAGALAALLAVMALGRKQGVSDPTTIVLAGVIVGAICAAGTMLAESALPIGRRGELTTWMLGRIPEAPEGTLFLVSLAVLAVAFGVTLTLGRSLDAAAMSDDEARSVGVSLKSVRAVLLVTAGAATAASVLLCGPVAFVGLIAPHVARGLVGPRHRVMCVGAGVAGAALLTGADAARQFIDLGGGRLPVGALTALLGGIAFLWLLRRTAGGWTT
jgi:iron complex transport system permease protein